MSVIHAIILGIIQGITEFLPVSSFGHLCGVQDLLGGTRGSGVLFEVMLHLGTMIALILVFLKDIKKIGIELIGMILDLIGNANIFLYNRRTGKELTYAKIISGTYRKLTALIMVSTIPTDTASICSTIRGSISRFKSWLENIRAPASFCCAKRILTHVFRDRNPSYRCDPPCCGLQ